jgi:hypothetical protein
VALQEIEAAGLRAGQMIGSIRAMFKKGSSEKQSVDLNQLIRDVLATVDADAYSARIRLCRAARGHPQNRGRWDPNSTSVSELDPECGRGNGLRRRRCAPDKDKVRYSRYFRRSGNHRRLGDRDRYEALGANFRPVLYDKNQRDGNGPCYLSVHHRIPRGATLGVARNCKRVDLSCRFARRRAYDSFVSRPAKGPETSSCSSTSKPPRRSASTSLRRFSPRPMSCSNNSAACCSARVWFVGRLAQFGASASSRVPQSAGSARSARRNLNGCCAECSSGRCADI